MLHLVFKKVKVELRRKQQLFVLWLTFPAHQKGQLYHETNVGVYAGQSAGLANTISRVNATIGNIDHVVCVAAGLMPKTLL